MKNIADWSQLSFDSLSIGETREFKHKITAEDIQSFAKLTGDYNPLHLDQEFARKTGFRKPVVYGMLSASFISTLIGMLIPGPGALWLSQNLNFLKQVYEGDVIRVIGRIKQISKATRILILETKIFNQNDQEIISGEASVRLIDLEKEETIMDDEKAMTVLITGASRGIGAAIARKLAAEGHRVIINYSRSQEEAEHLVQEIEAKKGKAIALQADVSNEEEVVSMFAKGTKIFGPIQRLVLNASHSINLSNFEGLTWESFMNQLNVQLKGAYLCFKAALPDMKGKKTGAVVIIGSVAADSVPPLHQTTYVVAKAALTALARSLAVEFGPHNIRVNIVSPGMTQTDLIAEIPERVKEVVRMQTPLRKLAKPEEIANTVAFLLDSSSSHITGENIRICGGASML